MMYETIKMQRLRKVKKHRIRKVGNCSFIAAAMLLAEVFITMRFQGGSSELRNQVRRFVLLGETQLIVYVALSILLIVIGILCLNFSHRRFRE